MGEVYREYRIFSMPQSAVRVFAPAGVRARMAGAGRVFRQRPFAPRRKASY